MILNNTKASEYRVRTLDRNDLNESGKIFIGDDGTETIDGVQVQKIKTVKAGRVLETGLIEIQEQLTEGTSIIIPKYTEDQTGAPLYTLAHIKITDPALLKYFTRGSADLTDIDFKFDCSVQTKSPYVNSSHAENIPFSCGSKIQLYPYIVTFLGISLQGRFYSIGNYDVINTGFISIDAGTSSIGKIVFTVDDLATSCSKLQTSMCNSYFSLCTYMGEKAQTINRFAFPAMARWLENSNILEIPLRVNTNFNAPVTIYNCKFYMRQELYNRMLEL